MRIENPYVLIKEFLGTDLSTLAMTFWFHYSLFIFFLEVCVGVMGCFHILLYASVKLHVKQESFSCSADIRVSDLDSTIFPGK